MFTSSSYVDFRTTLPMMIIALLATIALVVLLYIFVMPAKKRAKLPLVFKAMHDIFNFRQLLLETILKFVYVLLSVACIVFGFFMLFSFDVYDSGWSSYVHWHGGYGILLMLLGPIVIRIAFETTMMFILLVKNTIQINNKLSGDTAKADDNAASDETPTFVETPVEEAPAEENANPFSSISADQFGNDNF